jgi:hypothetical protein
VFVGIFVSTFALLGLTSSAARGPAPFGSWANATHRQAIERFILGFTAFWAYIAFDQYMLIWVANVPDEVAWYRVRTSGGWLFWAWMVVFAQFIIPMLALLSHRLKQSPRGLAAIGLWVLAAHAVDT